VKRECWNLKWRLSLAVGTYYFLFRQLTPLTQVLHFHLQFSFKVTAMGIDSDSDEDGIENTLDLCPNTPKGDGRFKRLLN
jgi:hypothetical protein